MHRLQRGAAPHCLGKYDYRHDTWNGMTPSPDAKAGIWVALDAMQGERCAYCEADIAGSSDRHIEHFRQRSRYPQGTFQWQNLFGSCNRVNSCGKHKDSCGDYDHQDLIKPDEEDPDDFFVFVSDGTIKVRSGLDAHNNLRATETLRIFNLDAENGPLRHMRKRAVAGYLQTAEKIRELAQVLPPEDWMPFLHAELAATDHLPFATTIRHALLAC